MREWVGKWERDIVSEWLRDIGTETEKKFITFSTANSFFHIIQFHEKKEYISHPFKHFKFQNCDEMRWMESDESYFYKQCTNGFSL